MSWALSVQFSSRYKGILGRSQLGDGNGSGVLGRHEGGAWVKAGERASENQEQKSEHVGSIMKETPGNVLFLGMDVGYVDVCIC